MIQILSRKQNNPALVGDAVLVKQLWHLALHSELPTEMCPDEMAKMRVLELDLMNVVAGNPFPWRL